METPNISLIIDTTQATEDELNVTVKSAKEAGVYVEMVATSGSERPLGYILTPICTTLLEALGKLKAGKYVHIVNAGDVIPPAFGQWIKSTDMSQAAVHIFQSFRDGGPAARELTPPRDIDTSLPPRLRLGYKDVLRFYLSQRRHIRRPVSLNRLVVDRTILETALKDYNASFGFGVSNYGIRRQDLLIARNYTAGVETHIMLYAAATEQASFIGHDCASVVENTMGCHRDVWASGWEKPYEIFLSETQHIFPTFSGCTMLTVMFDWRPNNRYLHPKVSESRDGLEVKYHISGITGPLYTLAKRYHNEGAHKHEVATLLWKDLLRYSHNFGYTYMFMLEDDAAVKPNADGKVYEQLMSEPDRDSILQYGTIQMFGALDYSPAVRAVAAELIAKGKAFYYGEGATAIFTNGALTVYNVPWHMSVIDQVGTTYDYSAGKILINTFRNDIFTVVRHNPIIYSDCGDVNITQEARKRLWRYNHSIQAIHKAPGIQ